MPRIAWVGLFVVGPALADTDSRWNVAQFTTFAVNTMVNVNWSDRAAEDIGAMVIAHPGLSCKSVEGEGVFCKSSLKNPQGSVVNLRVLTKPKPSISFVLLSGECLSPDGYLIRLPGPLENGPPPPPIIYHGAPFASVPVLPSFNYSRPDGKRINFEAKFVSDNPTAPGASCLTSFSAVFE